MLKRKRIDEVDDDDWPPRRRQCHNASPLSFSLFSDDPTSLSNFPPISSPVLTSTLIPPISSSPSSQDSIITSSLSSHALFNHQQVDLCFDPSSNLLTDIDQTLQSQDSIALSSTPVITSSPFSSQATVSPSLTNALLDLSSTPIPTSSPFPNRTTVSPSSTNALPAVVQSTPGMRFLKCPYAICEFCTGEVSKMTTHLNSHLKKNELIDPVYLASISRAPCVVCNTLVSTNSQNFNHLTNKYSHKKCLSKVASTPLSSSSSFLSSSPSVTFPSVSQLVAPLSSSISSLSSFLSPLTPVFPSSSQPSSAIAPAAAVLPVNFPIPSISDIFSTFVPLKRYIPKKCCSLFSRAFIYAVDKIRAEPDNISNWLQLLALPKCVLYAKPSKDRKPSTIRERKAQSERELARMSNDLNAFINGSWAQLWYNNVTSVDYASCCRNFSKDWQSAVVSKAEAGNLGAAFSVLNSSHVAPANDETFLKLQDLHPPSSNLSGLLFDPSFTRTISDELYIVEPEQIQKCVYSFPLGTAPGPDGLKVQHILDILKACPKDSEDDPRPSLGRLVSFLVSGKAPTEIAPFLGGARLVPLLKPDNGIRPIAIGCTWRRLAAKYLISQTKEEFKNFFEPCQLGIGTSNGLEAIIHSARKMIELNANNPDFVVFQVDFKNAFNIVDRSTFISEVRTHFPHLAPFVEWCYTSTSHLFVPTEGSTISRAIPSVNGTQQGDPLGPFLFSIVLNRIINIIKEQVPNLALNAWFLDDGTIAGPQVDVANVINIIASNGPALGLQLNKKKSVLFSPSSSPISDALFSNEFARSVNGITTLGCPLGNEEYIDAFFVKKLQNIDISLYKLCSLHDKHIALSILLKCVAFCKFSFYIRTNTPQSVIPHCKTFDSYLLSSLESIAGTGGLLPNAAVQASLPISKGGLGIRSTALHSPAAYTASVNSCQKLLLDLLASVTDKSSLSNESTLAFSKQLLSQNIDSPDKVDMLVDSSSQKFNSGNLDTHSLNELLLVSNERDKARILALQDSSQGLLFNVPLSRVNNFHLNNNELHFLVCSRLGVGVLCNDKEKCRLCQSPMDSHGYHAAICKSRGSGIKRHDKIRNIILNFCRQAAMSPNPPQIEPHCFRYHPNLRADIFLPNHHNGLALDTMVVHPQALTYISESSTSSLSASAKGESIKHDKYDIPAQQANIDFIPLVVEFYGAWGKEATKFFKKLIGQIADRFDRQPSDVSLQLYRELSVSLVRSNANAVFIRNSALNF
jgi:hypothetical protein